MGWVLRGKEGRIKSKLDKNNNEIPVLIMDELDTTVFFGLNILAKAIKSTESLFTRKKKAK